MRQLPFAALGTFGAIALLAASAAPPAPVATAPAAPPNGTYTYVLSRNGTDFGKTTVVVYRRDAAREIETDEAGTIGAARAHIVAAYRYADVTPDTYIATYRAPFVRSSALGRVDGARPHVGFDDETTVRYRLTDAGGNATIDGSAASFDLTIPAKDDKKPVRSVWILDGPFMTGALLLPAYRRRSGENELAPASVAFDDAAGAKLVAQRLIRAAPQFPKTPKSDLVIEEEGVARVWFDPGNYIVHEVHFAQLNIDARLTSYARAAAPITLDPAPEPSPNVRVPAIEFTFPSGDGTLLGGVMNVQSGLKKLPPVVVFVPPGPSASRNFGGGGPEPMYPELALAFAQRGYAVVRYDTRGVAKSGGSSAKESWDQSLADARAALQFATNADGVDRSHVYAFGYGSGADLALAASATADVPVAGVVALAPSVLTYRECAKRVAAANAAPATGDDASAEPNDGTWRKTSFAHDPTALAARTRVPLFVLHPGVATCGETGDDVAAYDDKLRSANPLATVVVASDLGARFGGRYDGDAPTNTEAIFPYRFDASTVGAIGDWFDSPKGSGSAGAANGSRPRIMPGLPRMSPRPPPAPDDDGGDGVPAARAATARPRPAPTPSGDVLPGQVVVPGQTPAPQPPPAPPAPTPQPT